MSETTGSVSTPSRSKRWDTSRFICLAKAHMAEHARRFLRFGLVLVGLFVVVFVFSLLLADGPDWTTNTQAFVYWTGLFMTGYAFASIYFEGMSRRGAALLWLMQPASVLEKTVLCALLVAVAYPLAYTALFAALNVPALALAIYQAEASGGAVAMRRYWPFILDTELLWGWEAALLLMVWGLQAWALASVLWFKRFGVMLGLVVAFVIMLITSLVVGVYAHAAWDVLGVWWVKFPLSGPIPLSFHVVNGVFWLGIPALMWVLVAINLRDKELLA